MKPVQHGAMVGREAHETIGTLVRRTWRSMLPFSVLIAAIVCWSMVNVQTVSVEREEDMAHVAFGWPMFDWIEQDQTRFSPVRFPAEMKVRWNKVDPLPTQYRWPMLVANIAVMTPMVWWVLTMLIGWGTRRNRREG